MVGEQQKPRFEAAFFRIELLRSIEDVQEDLLDHVFCFRFIASDTSRDSEKPGGVSFKQCGQSVSMSTLRVRC